MPGIARDIAALLNQSARRLTASSRALPNFIMAGAQKSGSSSLYSYLTQHPQVLRAAHKEIHYFDSFFHKGSAWYRSQFPLNGQLTEEKITGEATPSYLFYPGAAKRIAELVPDVKLILLLRNPVSRAISHYHHQIRMGNESLGLMEAIDAEEERSRKARIILQKDPSNYRASKDLRQFSYKERGVYVDQVETYFQHFDRSQIFIEAAETFFSETGKTLGAVSEFLGIDPKFCPPSLKPKNVGSYDKVDPQVYDTLNAYFAPHNTRLFDLLGEKFEWE